MADFIADLGRGVATAINATNTDTALLGNTGGTQHAEYADQPKNYNISASGYCEIRHDGLRVLEEHEASALIEASYTATFEFSDENSASGVVSLVNNLLARVFVNRGRTLLTTYVTDTGGNWLGKSGQFRFEIQSGASSGSTNPDTPRVIANLTFTGWVNWPLV